ncbi:hypothetical protein DW228_18315 [Bacteroides fragilis]|uniref:HAD family phosphatase n=1 Tax=Bacteroides fragilis TaxID=817 RepID=A0A396BU21_BACFG|nr:hypothetical protein [Bacteroides fragilis]RHH07888.1 hypothetical protein DW228_18315 [Bacteroides fragilis]
MRNDIILFDYGGVVAKDHQDPAEKELMDIFNVDRKTINSLLSEKTEHGAAFREGKISEKEFWDTVYLLSKFKGKCSYTYSELSTLFAKTYEMNMNLLDIIQKIRERYIVGILTNIDYARSCYLVNQLNINIFFDLYFPSYLYNSNKRLSDLWITINKIIKNSYPNSEIIYIDDRDEHVLSANQIGWIGIKYENIEALKIDIYKIMNLNGLIL